MPRMTEELHQKIDKLVKQAVREAVERKRALEQKVETKPGHSGTSSTR